MKQFPRQPGKARRDNRHEDDAGPSQVDKHLLPGANGVCPPPAAVKLPGRETQRSECQDDESGGRGLGADWRLSVGRWRAGWFRASGGVWLLEPKPMQEALLLAVSGISDEG